MSATRSGHDAANPSITAGGVNTNVGGHTTQANMGAPIAQSSGAGTSGSTSTGHGSLVNAPINAGNVLLPSTVAKLSLRLPPTLDPDAAGDRIRTLLEKDPPYGARIEYEPGSSAAGWNAPALSPWLEQSLAHASEAAFGAPPAYMGEGGSIPFMAMLGEKFPHAQFVVTGVLGPHSNAHGPNEFLHIPTARRISVVIAQVLADHQTQKNGR